MPSSSSRQALPLTLKLRNPGITPQLIRSQHQGQTKFAIVASLVEDCEHSQTGLSPLLIRSQRQGQRKVAGVASLAEGCEHSQIGLSPLEHRAPPAWP